MLFCLVFLNREIEMDRPTPKCYQEFDSRFYVSEYTTSEFGNTLLDLWSIMTSRGELHRHVRHTNLEIQSASMEIE